MESSADFAKARALVQFYSEAGAAFGFPAFDRRQEQRVALSQSFQRPDPLQFRKVENRQDALGQCNKATIAKQAEYPADMDRGQSNRVGNVLLAQRKWVALFAMR